MLFKKLWLKRRSVALTWLASYITILFVPIIVSVFVYQASSHTLNSEIEQANDSLLKQVREVIDNQFMNIIRLDTQLTLDPAIQNLMYADQDPDHNYSFDVYQIAQRLSFYQSSYSSVDQFYIYWNKGDSVLLPNAVENSRIAYQSFHQKGNISYDQWHSIVSDSSVHGFLAMPHLALDGTVHSAIAYTSTFMSTNGNSPVGKAVILIDDTRLLKAIQNVSSFNGGDVFILNKDNQVLLSTAKNAPSLLLANQQLSGASAQFFDKYNGQQAQYFMIRSANSELKYVTVTPSQLVWNKAEYVRNLTLVSILISILGGGILTYLFWRRNYNPLSRLVQSLNKDSNRMTEKYFNEYHFIQQAIATALDENAQIQQRLQQQNQLLRTHFISKMLKGSLDSQVPVEEALTAYDIQFQSDYFAVVLFHAESLGERMESVGGIDLNNKQNLLQFVASNVLEMMIAQHDQALVTEMDDLTACLVNFSTTQ
ncbi:MAG: transcriptional regulator, AraC family, partial [Bacilli bacterium]|nr:transcriptional regulator, AraC family [Bacilli bacterium]